MKGQNRRSFSIPGFLRNRRARIVAVCLTLYDLGVSALAYIAALALRFDGNLDLIPAKYLSAYKRFIPLYLVICLVVFAVFSMYSSIWRYASYLEMVHLLAANAVTCVCHVAGTVFIVRQVMPLSYYLGGAMIQALLMAVLRFGYRFVLLERDRIKARSAPHRNVMLIGAGKAGMSIMRELNRNDTQPGSDKVVCLIDDDRSKWGFYTDGVRVIGGRESIMQCVERFHIDKIYLTMPSASAEDRRDILNICNLTGCELKQLPAFSDMIRGGSGLESMKDVSVEDLLGRAQITSEGDLEKVRTYLRDKVVLVTGAGGSIGSELCRQIAGCRVKQLIMVDIYENSLYEIQLELKDRFPGVNIITLVGSVRDSGRMMKIFSEYRPEVVYHAAAHKHVPLMEDSPCEAVKNNTVGTYKTAYAAMMCGCRRFVLISTDKAVNPTNVMGATKRLCEMIIQAFDAAVKAGKTSSIPLPGSHGGPKEQINSINTPDTGLRNIPQTEFAAVRFGNVLGSNGSVVPLFRKMIAKGGPVLVTDPDITRYFMTIQEAVSLVLLAGTFAQGGDIFVLDMGEPVKIDTLARNLIRLSGKKPDEDIKIVYTGLRPGEKLYEEKLMDEEGLRTTDHNKIHIGRPIPMDTDVFWKDLSLLDDTACGNDDRRMVNELAKVVGTYHPSSIVSGQRPAV